MGEITLSVVAPAHNEEENVAALVEEIGAVGPVAARVLGGERFELVFVDDGSTDATQARALELAREHPWVRVVHMTRTPPGRGGGQSAACHGGFQAARGAYVATLDADLQNPPADIEPMARRLVEQRADMVQGDRSRVRRDGFIRKIGSRIGALFRRVILNDDIRDTGCSMRLMKREVAVSLPLEFKGMHRFMGVAARQNGFKVVELEVSHRPRVAGEPKYGLGIWQRAIPGLIDCFAVRWMGSRRKPVAFEEVGGTAGSVEGKGAAAGSGSEVAGAHA